MKSKIFMTALYSSGVCFCLSIALLILACLYPYQLAKSFSVSLCDDVRVCVARNSGGAILLFNDGQPYTGSAVVGKVNGWSGFGIGYVEVINSLPNKTWWTFAFSIWYPVIIFAVLPVAFAFKTRHEKRTAG